MTTHAGVVDESVVTPRLDFERFFADERDGILALALSLTGSRAAAEDLAQEAFTEAYQRWNKVGRYDKPGAWLRRVVLNRSVSGVRRRVTEARLLDRLGGQAVTAAPETADVDGDRDGDAFWASVRSLPRRQAQAVALHYLEDRSIAEIAEILDMAQPTVRVHLHRGRLALAKHLGLDQQEQER